MWKYILGGLGAFVMIMLLTLGGWAWKYYTAPIKGSVDAEVQLESGQSRIQFYNRFHDLCSLVQSTKDSIRIQKSLLETSEDNKERIRIRANLGGLEAQLSRHVHQYNTDSAKNYTAARFKDVDLPYKLSVDGETYCN